jgi:hypothetical protein
MPASRLFAKEGWSQPPILWVLVLAESGQRKTALLNNAFAPIRRVHSELWTEFTASLKQWHMQPEEEKRKTGKPPEPHSLIVNDVTIEKLQLILAANPRGTIMLKDEVVGLLEFGRYSGNGGAAERAFYGSGANFIGGHRGSGSAPFITLPTLPPR